MTTERLMAEMKEIEATQKFKGFTLTELRAAFEQVEDKDHWKNPIHAIILLIDYPMTAAAVEFFAGSRLDAVYVEPEYCQPRKCYVSGPGYYASVGA